jgi:hypothetical protein
VTEAEWLASADTKPMRALLGERATSRKQRLLACGCCRVHWHLFNNEALRNAVEVAERLADNPFLDDSELVTVEGAITEMSHGLSYPVRYVCNAAREVLHGGSDRWIRVPVYLVLGEPRNADPHEEVVPWQVTFSAKMRYVPTLFRDLFGNPFRPVVFSTSWRSDTAVSLAQQMYKSREFSAMPILADALQDAGCACEDVLNHCRDATATHVRGCWVVDLVLGKE